MSKDGGTPWPVWAGVTILVALIGAFGKGLFDRGGGEEAAPQPEPPSPAPEVFDAERLLTPRLGTYAGIATNRLRYARGLLVIDLKSIEPNGRARADIEWSQGLTGTGSIVGIVSDSTFELSGLILSETSGAWDTDVRIRFVSNDSLSGTYRLYPKPGNPNGTQDGEFGLHRVRR